jgi:hypothetical protein
VDPNNFVEYIHRNTRNYMDIIPHTNDLDNWEGENKDGRNKEEGRRNKLVVVGIRKMVVG